MDLVLISFSLFFFSSVGAQNSSCDFYQALKIGQKYQIFSRGYSGGKQTQRFLWFHAARISFSRFSMFVFYRNEACRWAAEAPLGYKVLLKCDNVFLFPVNMIFKEESEGEMSSFSFLAYWLPQQFKGLKTRKKRFGWCWNILRVLGVYCRKIITQYKNDRELSSRSVATRKPLSLWNECCCWLMCLRKA